MEKRTIKIFDITTTQDVDSWKEKFKKEDTYYISKKEYIGTFNDKEFIYRYLIDFDELDSQWFITINMIISPECVCDKFKKSVAECSGINEDEVTYYDIYLHGGGHVRFGCELSDEYKEDIITNIANVIDEIDAFFGFYMDKPINRKGNNGWDILKVCIEGKNILRY